MKSTRFFIKDVSAIAPLKYDTAATNFVAGNFLKTAAAPSPFPHW
jgi:hypothetical protein